SKALIVLASNENVTTHLNPSCSFLQAIEHVEFRFDAHRRSVVGHQSLSRRRGGKSQRWALGGPGGMPEPYSGVGMSQLLSCLFVFLWLARVFLLSRPAPDPLRFIPQLLASPEQLTPGLLLAVFPPLIVGVVKLVTALVV